MSYLNKLKAEKQASEKYEEETISLKQAIFEINNLYSLFDGDLLTELKAFLENYKRNKMKINENKSKK